AELSPIPAEVAQGMIQALAVSGNQPIGERLQRTAPASAPQSRSQGSVSPQPPPQQTAPSAPAVTRTSGKAIAIGTTFGGLTCFGVFGLILVVLALRVLKKSRR